jgi:hypothetical protein
MMINIEVWEFFYLAFNLRKAISTYLAALKHARNN